MTQVRNSRRRRRSDNYEYYGYGAAEDPSAVVEPGDVVAVPESVEALEPAAPEPVGRDLSMIPASIGQQIFAISSGVAGGLAGFVLAYKMANAVRVNTAEVIIASLIAMAGSFGAIFAIRTFH
jgi:hypothetical protein